MKRTSVCVRLEVRGDARTVDVITGARRGVAQGTGFLVTAEGIVDPADRACVLHREREDAYRQLEIVNESARVFRQHRDELLDDVERLSTDLNRLEDFVIETYPLLAKTTRQDNVVEVVLKLLKEGALLARPDLKEGGLEGEKPC